MMQRTLFVIVGGLIGAAIAALLVYFLGTSLEAIGIQLYHSEAAQQRNFNFAVSFVGILTTLGGYLGYRRGKHDA